MGQRALFPGRMTLPDNRPGNRYSVIPGVSMPDTIDKGPQDPAKIPINPYNHAFEIGYAVPQGNKGEAVGVALTPINTMDYPAKVLLPVFQAEQLREGRRQGLLGTPKISRDRLMLLPSNPFTMTMGYNQFRLRPDGVEFIYDSFIDFPVSWTPGHGRFQMDGQGLNFDRFIGMNIPLVTIRKKMYLEMLQDNVPDHPDFHFGQTLRPVNPLGLNLQEAYRRGEPLWQPVANSLGAKPQSFFVQKKKKTRKRWQRS